MEDLTMKLTKQFIKIEKKFILILIISFVCFQILEFSDNNNYQISCQRYFELSHKTEEIVPINHPNQYFEQSKRILNGNKPKGPNIKIEHIKIEMTQ